MTGVTKWIEPAWPSPPGVRAVFTQRHGGCSVPPFASLNLAEHVGDSPESVRENRRRLAQDLGLPASPFWLEQVHGRELVELTADSRHTRPAADGSWTRTYDQICAVMVADCLPVLLATRCGSAVAAIHAGWRGLLVGVLDEAVMQLAQTGFEPTEVLAWLGPCIGPGAFEIGPEVRAAYLKCAREDEDAFVAGAHDRWYADLHALATARLGRLGIDAVYSSEHCTFSEPDKWFSFRRDAQTGRMAALIWRENPART